MSSSPKKLKSITRKKIIIRDFNNSKLKNFDRIKSTMKKIVEKRDKLMINTSPLSNQLVDLKQKMIKNFRCIKQANKPVIKRRFKSPDIAKVLEIRSKMLSHNEIVHPKPSRQFRSRDQSSSILSNP